MWYSIVRAHLFYILAYYFLTLIVTFVVLITHLYLCMQMVQLFPPIFLNVEFSRSFINEYPVCASAKNIVMPYPSTDPDLISGRLFSNRPPRDKLVFYQGGNHGSCSFIRSALQEIIQNKKYALQRGPQKREFGFQSSVFCPIPVGDSPSSKRMYDVMNVSMPLISRHCSRHEEFKDYYLVLLYCTTYHTSSKSSLIRCLLS